MFRLDPVVLVMLTLFMSAPVLVGPSLPLSAGATAATTTCPLASNTVTVTTIGYIRSLPQSCSRPSSDKRGLENDACCKVEVSAVTVLWVGTSHDGDWKFGITDQTTSRPGCPSHCLIAEIDPAYQTPKGSVSRPTAGSTISVTGYVFCDGGLTGGESTNPSHYDSCWEIHPVTAWS